MELSLQFVYVGYWIREVGGGYLVFLRYKVKVIELQDFNMGKIYCLKLK